MNKITEEKIIILSIVHITSPSLKKIIIIINRDLNSCRNFDFTKDIPKIYQRTSSKN